MQSAIYVPNLFELIIGAAVFAALMMAMNASFA